VIGHTEPVDVVAGSLIGYLRHSVHLLEVVVESGSGEWVVEKWVVQRGMIGT
jgi:hypothetical protein